MIRQRFEKKVQNLIDNWRSEYLGMSESMNYVNLGVEDERDEGLSNYEFHEWGQDTVNVFADFMEKTVVRHQWFEMEPTQANIKRFRRFLSMQAASNLFLSPELKTQFQVQFYNSSLSVLIPVYVTDLSQIDFKECYDNLNKCRSIYVRPVEGKRWTKNKVARVVSHIRNDLGREPAVKVAMREKTKTLLGRSRWLELDVKKTEGQNQ
jgi:hypothetical protein